MPRYLFVTGKLAAPSLDRCLRGVPDLEYEITILPISVAAFLDTKFVEKHLTSTRGCDRIVIPGLCKCDSGLLARKLSVDVVRGPRDLKDIPAFFGNAASLEGYGEYRVKILAEIVDAYKMDLQEIMARAHYFRSSGADIVDLGCPVEGGFTEISKTVDALKKAGFIVSVDSFDPADILAADRAGVDLVLSINGRNMDLARDLRSKVVVIPDFENGPESLERNIAQLEAWQVPYVIDPILKPLCFGFTESIDTYIRVRRQHPESEMLLGLGNVTELTDADSTGINALMAGIVSELDINYVLTTEVISWTRGAVREFNLARQLMHFASEKRILPKHLDDRLITVKDPPFSAFGEDELRNMQAHVRDHHFRIFTDREFIYVFNHNIFVKGTDIQAIFEELRVQDASHAFYLGRELHKAYLALKLGKKYVQEEELRWGYLSP